MPNRKKSNLISGFPQAMKGKEERTHQGTPLSFLKEVVILGLASPPSTDHKGAICHSFFIKQPNKNQHHIVVKADLAVSSSTKKKKVKNKNSTK